MGRKKSTGYAIAITKENIYGVIRSEAGPNFDLEAALTWFEKHGGGWFLRDDSTVLDCHFFDEEIFPTLYEFIEDNPNELMRHVISVL